MRNMKKQSKEGQKKITNERYDLSAGEIRQLLDIAQDTTIRNRDGLFESLGTAFYAGVNVGYRVAEAEEHKREEIASADGQDVTGCPFCGVKENGDVPADLRMLLRVKPSFKAVEGCGEVSTDPVPGVSTGLDIGVYNGRLVLFIGQASEAVRKINYCPICGRKF